MRAQHQTKMTVHVRKSNRGMKQQSINKQAKQQKSAKEPATGYRYVRHRLLLNRRGHSVGPTQGARSLEPLFSYLVFRTGLQLDETAASLLHCTALLHTGHTQTRVDLRFAPLLL